MTGYKIRPATEKDLKGILTIVNHEINTGTANFAYSEVILEEIIFEFQEKTKRDFPFFVAIDGNIVTGFATYGTFRKKEGYNSTAELSIYIHPEHQRKGIGKALMKQLIQHAKAHHITSLIAGIADENESSIKFHKAFLFVEVGYLPRVAKKFGRELNLVFMQLEL